MKLVYFFVIVVCVVIAVTADGEVWEENDHEVLIRNERGVNNRETCRYVKGPWSECDKSNTRSRTLTLKKGDASTCEQTKTIQKKCKKRGCRYEKAPWSQCKENGEMTRTDILKANSDSGCEPNRQITKKCNRNKMTKDKGTRRNRQ